MNLFWQLVNGAALNLDEAWWAVEPSVLFALHWLGVAACCFIVGSVCCRIDSMRSRVASKVWAFIFMAWGAFALGTLIDQLRGHRVDWYALLGVFAVASYLLKTRHLWKRGPPKETDSLWHLFGDKQ